jgi:hypothetical protein
MPTTHQLVRAGWSNQIQNAGTPVGRWGSGVVVESCQFALSISQLVLSRVVALKLGSVTTDLIPKPRTLCGKQAYCTDSRAVRLNFGYARPSRGQARQDGLSKLLKMASIHHAAIECFMPDASLSMHSLRRDSDGKQGRQAVLVCFCAS